jgi:S1-C subfamily serine protease
MRRLGRLESFLAAAVVLAVLLALGAEAALARPWAWLGVRIRDLSEQEMDEIAKRHGIREGFGVVIVEVLEGAPAARAGVKSGDIVVALGERPVTETRMLQRLIARASTESDTRLTVLRPEGRRQVAVRLAAMPPDVMGDRVAAEFGFVLRDPQAPAGAPGRLGPADGSPTVAAVLQGSPAAQAGMQVGDVLVEVGDRPVVTREAVRESLAETALDRPLRLGVRRGDQRLSLTLVAP